LPIGNEQEARRRHWQREIEREQ